MKEKRDTKQAILFEALHLFSVHGYDGVSVKDIADAVGVKDSSLYKHYKSKQDIFDSLMREMNRQFEAATASYLPQGKLPDIVHQYGGIQLSFLQEISQAVFLYFLRDAYASQFRRMLMIEQYKNNAAGDTFRDFYIETALSYQSNLFGEMMRMGYFRQADPEIAALHFYSPIFLMLSRYDLQPERESEALDVLRRHIEQFHSIYVQH